MLILRRSLISTQFSSYSKCLNSPKYDFFSDRLQSGTLLCSLCDAVRPYVALPTSLLDTMMESRTNPQYSDVKTRLARVSTFLEYNSDYFFTSLSIVNVLNLLMLYSESLDCWVSIHHQDSRSMIWNCAFRLSSRIFPMTCLLHKSMFARSSDCFLILLIELISPDELLLVCVLSNFNC
jgi:hypothetical protein